MYTQMYMHMYRISFRSLVTGGKMNIHVNGVGKSEGVVDGRG